MLNKSSWMFFRAIGSRSIPLKKLAEEVGHSLSWMSEIITAMELDGFVEKKALGQTHHVSTARTAHAQALQALIIEIPGIKYEQLLYGKRILVAWALLHEAKNVSEIAQVTGVHPQIVRGYLRNLRNRGWVVKDKQSYMLNKKKELLWKFLESYRHYSNVRGRVLWKFGDEILFQSQEPVDATPTGFTAFSDLGVRMHDIHYTYFLPKRKLLNPEIAIHSLIQVSDPRELALVIVFVLKHRLTFKNLQLLAVKYDCKGRLDDLFKIMRSTDSRIITERLPSITKRELDDTLKLYGIKNI